MYRCTGVQDVCKDVEDLFTGVHLYRYKGVHLYRCTNSLPFLGDQLFLIVYCQSNHLCHIKSYVHVLLKDRMGQELSI